MNGYSEMTTAELKDTLSAAQTSLGTARQEHAAARDGLSARLRGQVALLRGLQLDVPGFDAELCAAACIRQRSGNGAFIGVNVGLHQARESLRELLPALEAEAASPKLPLDDIRYYEGTVYALQREISKREAADQSELDRLRAQLDKLGVEL